MVYNQLNLTCQRFIHQATWDEYCNLSSVQYNKAPVLFCPLYKLIKTTEYSREYGKISDVQYTKLDVPDC